MAACWVRHGDVNGMVMATLRVRHGDVEGTSWRR